MARPVSTEQEMPSVSEPCACSVITALVGVLSVLLLQRRLQGLELLRVHAAKPMSTYVRAGRVRPAAPGSPFHPSGTQIVQSASDTTTGPRTGARSVRGQRLDVDG